MNSRREEKPLHLSFRRRLESSPIKKFWTPAFAGVTTLVISRERVNYGALMKPPPDERTFVEISFIEQLIGLGWEHVEGDIDVPYHRERESFRVRVQEDARKG
jgi:hypothetical protein